mmetsp:Transcript_14369/g.22333  ORF Transcript_14369/g.22333 Transcript_14369/m.22333 type:complete len:102 (-) Transcript_14369:53-358(-)
MSTTSGGKKSTIQHEKAIDLGLEEASNYLKVNNVDLDQFPYSVHESTFRKDLRDSPILQINRPPQVVLGVAAGPEETDREVQQEAGTDVRTPEIKSPDDQT